MTAVATKPLDVCEVRRLVREACRNGGSDVQALTRRLRMLMRENGDESFVEISDVVDGVAVATVGKGSMIVELN